MRQLCVLTFQELLWNRRARELFKGSAIGVGAESFWELQLDQLFQRIFLKVSCQTKVRPPVQHPRPHHCWTCPFNTGAIGNPYSQNALNKLNHAKKKIKIKFFKLERVAKQKWKIVWVNVRLVGSAGQNVSIHLAKASLAACVSPPWNVAVGGSIDQKQVKEQEML